MSAKPLIKIRSLLNSNAIIEGLLSAADRQQALQRQICELLPDALHHHCKAALMEEDRLLIYADSSVWASRLRYFSRNLKSQLQAQGVAVTKITVRVMLDNPILAATRRPNRPVMSAANATLIQRTAEGIADPELRAALQRLGKRAQ